MASSSVEKMAKKRRGKVVIKEVKQANRRYVTFSKRKLGLFNKLTEISLLCQVDTALIIISPNRKLYSCGYPDPDTVVRRYLSGVSPLCRRNRATNKDQQEFVIEKQRLEYEAVHNQLKEEKKYLQIIKETSNINNNGFFFHPWWNLSTENMDLENLEQFKTSLERLKFNLVGALQEKHMNSFVPSMLQPAMVPAIMPYNMVPPMPSSTRVPSQQFSNISHLAQHFSGNQVQDYRRSGAVDYRD